jgi:2'-5' RNA ligase
VPRVRLGVVLLVPPPQDAEIDGLRRACGDPRLGQVAPHLTLVPPVNVRGDALASALAVLRAAGAGRARAGPLTLPLGPPAVFHPASDTLFLAVGGPADGSAGELGDLRAAVLRPPLARPLTWDFVPHVTLADGIDERRARAAVEALGDYTVTITVDRLHLLEERRDPASGRRRWVPVADMPFARPAVVGRGGVELEVHRSVLADPEAVALAGAPAPPPEGARPLVVSARRHGRLVGVARGWVRDGRPELAAIVVAEDQRRQGVGRQLRLAFAADAL